MKQERIFQLNFSDLQLQECKVKSEFFKQINSVTDSLCRPRGLKEYEVIEGRYEDEGTDIVSDRLVERTRSGVDTEARWVKKGGKSHFGYSRLLWKPCRDLYRK